MKKIIFLLFVSVNVLGQSVDYDKIILPSHVQSPEYREKLVQLAWQNHPLNEGLRNELRASQYAVKRNNADWWDILQIQGNLNEFTVNKYILGNEEETRSQRADFYPLYNIRASIPLGLFSRITTNKKIGREMAQKAESNLNDRKLEIRHIVLKAHNDYLLRQEIFKMQAQMHSDAENAHKLMDQKFKSGETNFDAFSQSQASYNRAKVLYLTAKTDYENAKLDLERLIGVALEDVQ